MDADTYQALAARTLLNEPNHTYTGYELMLVWNAVGIGGEAGEVLDLIKKFVFHRHQLDEDKLIKELGDVMWYVAGLCTTLGVPLSEVMERNITKLQARYPEGYSSERSINRED